MRLLTKPIWLADDTFLCSEDIYSSSRMEALWVQTVFLWLLCTLYWSDRHKINLIFGHALAEIRHVVLHVTVFTKVVFDDLVCWTFKNYHLLVKYVQFNVPMRTLQLIISNTDNKILHTSAVAVCRSCQLIMVPLMLMFRQQWITLSTATDIWVISLIVIHQRPADVNLLVCIQNKWTRWPLKGPVNPKYISWYVDRLGGLVLFAQLDRYLPPPRWNASEWNLLCVAHRIWKVQQQVSLQEQCLC